ncbi:hypothetical protein QQ045_027832 [Rhodiola kirilowii]
MNNHYGDLHDEVTVPGFERPKSPDASYSNIYLGAEDLAKEPPLLHPQLQNTLLSQPVDTNAEAPLPLPQNATINHLYIENRDALRSAMALGVTHRFRSKFVTFVLYNPVQKRG